MSTIVVVRKNNDAVIAADTLTSFGELRQSAGYDRHSDKIQKFGSSYMGIVGSAAHSLVVDRILRRKDLKVVFSSREKLFQTFLAMHKILKEQYYLNPKDEDDDPYESSRLDGLIAGPSGIFGVYALREVYEYQRFWAIGSGADYALGAMYACYDELPDAVAVAKKGVLAGAEFNTQTGLPMTLHKVRLQE